MPQKNYFRNKNISKKKQHYVICVDFISLFDFLSTTFHGWQGKSQSRSFSKIFSNAKNTLVEKLRWHTFLHLFHANTVHEKKLDEQKMWELVSRGYFSESNSSGELFVYVGRQLLRDCHFLYFELFFFFVFQWERVFFHNSKQTIQQDRPLYIALNAYQLKILVEYFFL